MVAKDAGNGDGFIKVIEVSGRAVGIDVVTSSGLRPASLTARAMHLDC